MNKSFVVDSTFVDMRLDRFLRNKLGNLPQSLIEKNLRNGKIKLNKKKVKSSFKLKLNDSSFTFENELDKTSPGQACVFYKNDQLVGGVWITP